MVIDNIKITKKDRFREEYSADLVAKVIIKIAIRNEKPVDNLTLGCLLYYVQCAFLVSFDKRAFREDITRTKFSVFVLDVYKTYRGRVDSPITRLYEDIDENISMYKKDFKKIEEVVKANEKFNMWQIRNKVALEVPCSRLVNGDIVTPEMLVDYYSLYPDLIYGKYEEEVLPVTIYDEKSKIDKVFNRFFSNICYKAKKDGVKCCEDCCLNIDLGVLGNLCVRDFIDDKSRIYLKESVKEILQED